LELVGQDKEYMQAWEEWIVFASRLLNEPKQVIGE